MKKKKLISVITLIITGLFLTSITGMSVFTQKNAMTENTVTDFLQMQDESIHSTSGLADPPQSPSTPIYAADGAHVHDHPNDMNKGIGIRCIWNPIMGLPQTFTTTSNNSGDNIFYKIFFGDGQDSGWLGPFSSGQVSSAVHDYAAIGNFSVTAICKINATESEPSNAIVIRMYYVGDTNGDGAVNFGDIHPFILQISAGKNAYYNSYPQGYFYSGDVDCNGIVNFGDINAFVYIISGMCPQYPSSPSAPIHAADGAHVHDHPNDMNKGIGIRCIWNPIMGLPQTFTTTSNNSGDNIFYKIFFGDGQDSGWLGPFSTGQVSSAVHDYAAIGNFSVTAVCRMNGMESRSSDPTIVQMYYLGDTRGNNGIGYDDIGTFVLQISGGKNSYYNGFPLGYFYTGDLSNDGLVNFSDINSFVTLLSGGCPQ